MITIIAQEVRDALPASYANIVSETEPANEGDPSTVTLDYSRMLCLAWGTLKHMDARVKALETQLAAPQM